MNYKEFLKSKQKNFINAGFNICEDELNAHLFDFQKSIVKWALARGRSAVFAGTGLGKTIIQLEWAHRVNIETGKNVIIVAPLSVAHQTIREGDKFGIEVNYSRDQADVLPGITITNYEMLDKFDMTEFIGIVLDESSILKHQQGKVRTQIINSTKDIPYKLSCTATPSPNDYMELGSQCEFLGIMTAIEMLAMFFVHDGGETSKWRLKGHAKYKFWEWMASWSVFIQNPSDLGFDGSAYILPSLNIIEHKIETNLHDEGSLFVVPAQGLSERRKASRTTLDHRCKLAADIVNNSDDNFLVWCHLNDESDMLRKQIHDSEDVKGSYSIEKKENTLDSFSDGTLKNLITKPSIAGFGMNWQHINNMVFVGLNDSWEMFYQAIRRSYRFGQDKEVNVHIITTDLETAVLNNIKRKEKQAATMMTEMARYMADFTKRELKGITMEDSSYIRETQKTDQYEVHHADCIDLAREIPDESIDYTVYSPPFESLYTYSNSDRDMGNSKDTAEFWDHYKFLIAEHLRITKPGRLVSVHCMNLPTSKVRDGQIGLRDFRGEIIRQFIETGFIYHSEVAIWKDPVVAMQRTKALGLLHKQIKKDSSMSRMGIPDYVVTFRKPGENKNPISHTADEFPVQEWQKIASPIWTDIKQGNTLQYRQARDGNDERHIAPLQLDVIERCLRLWSNPGDLVFSPFTGIGSEGFMSIKMGRRFIGSELKKSYYDIALKNLFNATKKQLDMFEDAS